MSAENPSPPSSAQVSPPPAEKSFRFSPARSSSTVPPEHNCVTLIGMAGAGKTTVGRALARSMGWAFLDTDFLIEAAYAAPLQAVADATSKEEFLDLEAAVISRLRISRSVLATGGSVIYRPETMRFLASLGPIVYLDVPLPLILERIARKPDRGLAIAPGQTVEDLFHEREILYRRYAGFILEAAALTPAQCVRAILEYLRIDQASPPEEPAG